MRSGHFRIAAEVVLALTEAMRLAGLGGDT
jgi:hypothetical protein